MCMKDDAKNVILEDFSEWVMELARVIADNSGGAITLVEREQDDTSSVCDDAAHFLKLNHKRLGRDVELYGFMGKITGIEPVLPDILMEIMLPIKADCSESYEKAAEMMKERGKVVYDSATHIDFCELF